MIDYILTPLLNFALLMLAIPLTVIGWVIAIIVTPYWRKHEREALNRAGECKPVPHCSQGYDFEIPQTTEIDWDAVLEEIKSDMSGDA